MTLDVSKLYPKEEDAQRTLERDLSAVAATMLGSRILSIAAEVKALAATDPDLCNLTVGDFSPAQFPIPEALNQAINQELAAGESNYPPADGMPALREAITDFYAERLGLSFPVGSVVVGSGARPPIFSTYACLLEPGDTVLYAVPSWNNEYYIHLNQARAKAVVCQPENGFMPTLADLEPHLSTARVLHLNSPLNPCGTCISREGLEEISRAVVAENKRRAANGERSLFLLYDMVYWLLTFGETEFHHPISLVPEIAPWVISVDAISKWMAATGLRVGWGIVPPHLQGKFKAFVGHMGAWAPRPVQLATAQVLRNPALLDDFLDGFKSEIQERLDTIYNHCSNMAAEGLPVRAIEPQGAIYLSVQINLIGRTLPSGEVVESNEQVRQYLLKEARVAVVPFRAFGLESETGWFRMSVGAVSTEALARGMERIATAIRLTR